MTNLEVQDAYDLPPTPQKTERSKGRLAFFSMKNLREHVSM
jgi:hypothetical protein